MERDTGCGEDNSIEGYACPNTRFLARASHCRRTGWADHPLILERDGQKEIARQRGPGGVNVDETPLRGSDHPTLNVPQLTVGEPGHGCADEVGREAALGGREPHLGCPDTHVGRRNGATFR